MRRLILFRHGKAEIAGVVGGDKARRLADRGRLDVGVTAAWLLAAGFTPDLVLVSSASRTRETWDCIAATFSAAKVEILDDLYLAGPDTIGNLVEAISEDFETVMVVGHNPGLQDLSVCLATEGEAPEAQISHIEEGFPTAAAVAFRRDDTGMVRLESIYEPPRGTKEQPRWTFLAPGAGAKA